MTPGQCGYDMALPTLRRAVRKLSANLPTRMHMRKRSSYRPRPVIRDTMQWIKQGFAPLTNQVDADRALRLRNHLAFDGILHGDADAQDLDTLIAMSNMATALARQHGADWRAEIRAAADAIEAMQIRYTRWHKVQATASELEAVRLLLRIHDAQLDATNVRDLELALERRNKGVAA